MTVDVFGVCPERRTFRDPGPSFSALTMARYRTISAPKAWRDTVLFLAGLAGIGWETVANNADRPTLLILFGAMCGLPVFLRSDEAAAPPTPPPEKVQEP